MTKHVPVPASNAIDSLPESWVADRRGRPEQVAPPSHLAASYSRYSTDKQSFLSVERQVAACSAYVEQIGRTMYFNYADEAKSGTSEVGRDALAAMMLDAKDRKFGIVVVENIDRLARDLSYASLVFKQLAQLGIEMHQPGRGKLNVVDIAWQAVMGQESRRLLIERTSFARENMAREGRFPTGRVYGYERAPGGKGHLVIVDQQAETVRRMYDLRLEGLNARNIAFCINASGEADKTWTDHGVDHVLQNPLYNGVLVYKRHMVSRDPDTRQRKITRREPKDWIITKVPHLRIVEEDVWEAVQAMKAERQLTRQRKSSAPRQYLLSMKVKCPGCGGNMTVIHGSQKPYFECSSYKGSRICKSNAKVSVAMIDETVIRTVGEHLLTEGCAEAYAAAYTEARALHDRQYVVRRAKLKKRLELAQRKLDAAFDNAFMQGFTSEGNVAQRIRVQREQEAAAAELATLPRAPTPVALNANRMTTLRDALRNLSAVLPFRAKDEASMRLMVAMRDLVERVDWVPLGYSKFDVTVTLNVGSILAPADGSPVSAGEAVRLSGSYRWRGKGYALSEQAKVDAARLAEGAFKMTEAEWREIHPLVPEQVLTVKGGKPLPARTLIEAILFHMLTDCPWLQVPASFAPFKALHSSARRLSYQGAWTGIRAKLLSLDEGRYGCLRENLFSASESMRSRKLPKAALG